MNTSNWMKRITAIVGSALMGLMFATVSYAATESVVAEVTFATPVTILEVNPLQYGVIDVAMATETIIIAPGGGLSGTGLGLIVGGTQAAANLTIFATALQNLSIQVGSIIPGAGYLLSNFTCKYAAELDADCQTSAITPASVGTSATLLIGAQLTGNNPAAAGVVNGSFIVTVTYQ